MEDAILIFITGLVIGLILAVGLVLGAGFFRFTILSKETSNSLKRFLSFEGKIATQPKETPTGRPTPVDREIETEVCDLIGKDWKKLARRMRLTNEDIEKIEVDNSQYGTTEMAYKTMVNWMRKEGEEATEKALYRLLRQIGRKDIVLKISSMSSAINSKARNADQSPSWKTSRQPFGEGRLSRKTLQERLQRRYKMFMMQGLPWMDNVRLSLGKNFVELEISEEAGHGQYFPTKKFKLEEIFASTSTNGERPSRILVEGAPGFGKTTLATKLCYDFGHQRDYMKHVDLAFIISMRNFSDTLDEMICNAANVTKYERGDVLDMINDESIRTLLILDGFDELLNEHVECVLALIRGEIYPHLTVLVTSRPGMFTSKSSISQHSLKAEPEIPLDVKQVWDKRTKIVGVSTEKQAEFLSKHLSDFSPEDRGKVETQMAKLKDSSILTPDFLQCPLVLFMVVFLITKECTSLEKLKTRTHLLKHIMNFIMHRFFAKHSSELCTVDLFCFDNAERPDYVDLMTQLGAMSLTAIKENRLFFSQKDVKGYDSRILKIGVLTRTSSVLGFQEIESYQPLHKSLVEFAASYFLWIQFIGGQTDKWKENIINLRPTFATAGSSLLFPFLTGLMGNNASAIFDVLFPYAAEYSAVFESLISTLCEADMNESLLHSLTHFLPIRWNTEWPNVGLPSSVIPAEIMFSGLEMGKIKQIMWYLAFPVRFCSDIKVHRLFLFVENEVAPVSEMHFKRIKCRSLICDFSTRKKDVGNKWRRLLSLFQSIQFQNVNFLFRDHLNCLLFFPLMYEVVTNGILKDAEIHYIECELQKTTSHLLDKLTDLIQREKINALWITLDFLPSEDQLSALFTSISKSVRLTNFILSYKQESVPLTVNFSQLCNGGQKSFDWLHICNAKVENNANMKVQNCVIKLVQLPRVYPTPWLSSVLQSYQIESFCGYGSSLAGDINLFHESVTELDIIIDNYFLRNFIRFSNFPNVQLLTLTMTSLEYQPASIEKCLLTTFKHLPLLKGIRIDQIEHNLPLARLIMKYIFKFLERNASSPESAIPGSDEFQLQYLSLMTQIDPDISNPSATHSSRIRELVSLILFLKQSSIHKSLSQLDIIVYYDSLLKHIATVKPYDFSSFVDIFPPEEGFIVDNDYPGMREDDSIQVKLRWSTIPHQPTRFSVIRR